MAREQLLALRVTFDDDTTSGVGRYADHDTGVTAADVGALRTALGGGLVARGRRGACAPSRSRSATAGSCSSDERDALGQRRLELRYARSPDIESSIRRILELVARELGRAGVGRLRIDLDDTDKDTLRGPARSASTSWGRPAWPATRSRASSTPNLRVHGTDNLYVASSSVFPTVGYANPTLTIVALTLRLADRLAGRLR